MRSRNSLRKVYLGILAPGLISAVAALMSPVLAEEGGTMRGRVTDAQGNPVPAATITIRSKSNPAVNNQGTLSNAKGEFRVPLLPPGNDYEVSCAFPGFATVIKRPVDITAGTITTVEFVLIEEQVEKIVVEARGDVVDTEKTTASTAVSTEFLAGLPILGRTFSDTLTLAPGVTDTDGDGEPNVKGAREVDFQLRVSGVQTNDPFGGGKAIEFNIEAIEEIQILTGALTAEYSSQGGVGVVSTRSGGNEFEGSAKIFYQSRSIDGDGAHNNDFNDTSTEPPSFRTLRPFVTAGGAFKKDRVWYFTALEYLDEQEPIVFGPTTRNTSQEGHRDFAKVTWQINPEHKAALELHYEPTETFGNNIGPTIGESSDFHFDTVAHLYTLRETAVFSPTLFLDSTFSLFEVSQETYPVHTPSYSQQEEEDFYSTPPRPELLNFVRRTGVSIIPIEDEVEGHYLQDADNRTVRGPFFLNQSLDGRQFTLREDLSFYVDDWLGSHTFKSGIELQRQDHHEETEFRPIVVRALAQRGGGTGFIYNFNAPVPAGTVPLESERYDLGFYMQDTWKPIPNLTLNIGVRLDREVMHSEGRTPFDPQAEVDEYNRLALLFYANASAAGNEVPEEGSDQAPPTGQVRTGTSLNFEINPETDRFFCDLDGDGTCNGRTSPTGAQIAGIPTNSDTAILRGIFSRDNFDCSLIPNWSAATSAFSGSGRPCIGNETNGGGPLREGTDLTPEEISLGNTNVAPRFSASYDPFADGKTKLYATWGRFYGQLFLATMVQERRADAQSLTVRKLERAVAPHEAFEGAFTIYQVSRDLRTPYTDEFTLGLERELAPELALKVIYTQRKGRDQLQDKDINHVTADRPPNADTPADGIPDDCLFGTLGKQTVCDPDGSPDIEPLNPNFNQIFLLGNFNTSEFRSLELALTKRLHRNWQFETSYTWSEARGNAEDFLSLLGDDPSQTELEEGFLSFDQRHVVKFNAVAQLPKEFQVGGSITYESGLPFSIVNRNFVVDNMDNFSFRTIFPTKQRNDQRNKSLWTFNANIKKALTFGGRVKGTASLDIFDILNSDDLRINSVNRAIDRGLQVSDPVDPATRQFGRRFQLGLELHF